MESYAIDSKKASEQGSEKINPKEGILTKGDRQGDENAEMRESVPMNARYYGPPPPYGYYAESDEIDLRQYIEILWKWKWAIAALTLTAVAAAGIMSFFVMVPVYEASTQIMVPRNVLPNDVITSPYFLQKVLSQLNLGAEYDPFTLSRAISVQAAKVPDLTIIKVQDKDPAVAEKIVNTLAESFVTFVKDHNAQVSSGIVKELQAKKTESENALFALKKERDQLVSGQDLPALRLEVSRLASLVTDRRTALLQAESRESELKKGIEELEKSLAQTPKTVAGPLDYAGRPTVVPNETYQQLEQSLAYKKVSLAEVQVQLANIREALPALEAQYQVKQKTVLDAESKISDIEDNISRLNAEIAAFNTEIIKTSSSLPEASVVAPAITPKLPVKPRKLLNMAVAGILGGFISVFGVFFIEYWRSPRKYGAGESAS